MIFHGKDWHGIGNRNEDLLQTISDTMGVPQAVLSKPYLLHDHCFAERMRRAAKRLTTQKEDKAYSLLSIFGVNTPLLHGEEGKAF